jgi:hypothetical protein
MLLLIAALLPTLAFAGTSGPSPIPNPPAFQLSTNTLTLCKGVINNIPVTISNLGKYNGSITMDSLQLSLGSGRSIVSVANGSSNLLTLAPNTTRVVNLPVFVNLTAPTLVSTSLSINYNYLNYYSDSEVRNVSFGTLTCPSQLTSAIIPTVLTSGKIENITLNLTNTGVTPLTSVSVKASLPNQDGQVLSVQPVTISAIAPSGSAHINENVFVYSNASQTFPVNLSISLYNGTRLEQLAPSIAVLSSGIINMSASSVTISPANPSSGSIFSISFVLTDLGTVGASAVTATVAPPTGFTAYGSNSVFIGSMQVDSQTPVTLSLSSASSVKQGSYTIPVKISYLNNLRQQINSTLDVPVTVGTSGLFASNAPYGSGNYITYSHRTSSGGGLLVLLLVVAVIALALLFLRERGLRRKAMKEAHHHG